MKKSWNRALRSVKQWSRLVRERCDELPVLYVAGLSFRFQRRLKLIGNNWKRRPDLPVAFMVGFNVWKRDDVSRFLPEYRTAYLEMQASFSAIRPLLDEVADKVMIVWGYSEPELLQAYADQQGIPFYRMEDGFFRSVGLGADHQPPLSLVLDKTGLYFDANQPSDLETLLANYEFQVDSTLMAQAEACLSLVLKYGITKYNFSNSARVADGLYGPKPGKRILVVGQVENDASILRGCDTPITNRQLLETAIRENPQAQIIYKPHPDVLLKGRAGKTESITEAANLLILDQHVTVPQSLETIDHVYTITSLTGFEATLRNIPVTVLGRPFYAGWGLTDDRSPISRRCRMLNALELFAGACLLYPRYKGSGQARPASLEGVLLELIARTRYPEIQPVSLPNPHSPEYLGIAIEAVLQSQGALSSAMALLGYMRKFSAGRYAPVVARVLPLLLEVCRMEPERVCLTRMGHQLLPAEQVYRCLQITPEKTESEKNETVLTVLEEAPASRWERLLKQCQYSQAERQLHRLLEADAFSAGTYEGLANVHAGRLDYENALFYARMALAFSTPKERARRLFRLGELSLKLECLNDAHVYFWASACLNSDFTFRVFHYTRLSNVYSPLDIQYETFVAWLRNLEKPSPNDRMNLGRSYLNLAQFDEAVRCLEEAARMAPDCVKTRIWLAHAYSHVQRYDEAACLFRQALDMGKHATLCIREYLRMLIDKGAFEEAEQLLERATRRRIEVGAEWEIKIRLGRHQIQPGFKAYRRMKLAQVMADCYPGQYFQGVENLPVHAESLLVIALYGPGDEVRWATLYGQLRQRFPSVRDIYVTCDPRLQTLFQRSFPDLQFIGVKRTGRKLPADEIPLYNQVKSEWLATVMDNRVSELADTISAITFVSDCLGDCLTSCADFPLHTGYLKPDPVLRRYWRKRLDALGTGQKIGINWRSSLTTYNRDDYYTDIRSWDAVLSVPGCAFINLQYDDCREELQMLQSQYGHEVIVFPELDLYNDFESLAALISELDLVIAPATNIVEVAGAVGQAVWLLSNVSALHWRMHPETGQDLWHPQLVHIQGDKIRDKKSLIENLALQLMQWSTRHQEPDTLSAEALEGCR